MITIIIVVYKTDKILLNRFLKNLGNDYKLIVINNSKNYNFKNINLPKNTKVIKSKNLGNGAGINLGIRNAKTNFVIYFDIDTIFEKKFLSQLSNIIKKNDNFAVMIPNTGKYPTSKKFIEKYNAEAPIMLFNLNKFKNKELFDEKIFLYFEETDLFFQCKKNYKKVFISTKTKIKHIRSSSIIKNNLEIEFLRQWHYMWSMFYYYKKNYYYLYGIKKTIFFLIKDISKLFYYLLFFDKKNIYIRYFRIYGLLCSYLLLPSFKRISKE